VGGDPADHQHHEVFPVERGSNLIILFYTPLANTMKAIFEDYAGYFKTQESEIRPPCVISLAALQDKNAVQLKFAP